MRIRSWLVALLCLWGTLLPGCGYNAIQANEEAVKEAWGDVESAYHRRADLVPSLVTVVRFYASH